jgi:hypothetical protein
MARRVLHEWPHLTPAFFSRLRRAVISHALPPKLSTQDKDFAREDAAGFNHWLNKMNSFGDFLKAEMVRSFLISPEYRQRSWGALMKT